MIQNKLLFLLLFATTSTLSFSQNIADVLFGKDCKKDYIGQYNYNGKRKNGFGIERYRNGSFYVGDFSENEISGRGMMIMNGKSISHVDNAMIYIGNWYKGKKSGNGVCYDSAGNMIYSGKFSNDKPIEKCDVANHTNKFAMLNTDRGLYLGEVISDTPDGFGLVIENDGSVVYGTKKKGLWEGLCMTFYTEDIWEVGIWKNGAYNPFNNSQIAENKLQDFFASKKEWKKDMRSSLFEAAGNFAKAGLTTLSIVNGIEENNIVKEGDNEVGTNQTKKKQKTTLTPNTSSTCTHCYGTGICNYCNGAGVNYVGGNPVQCTACRGTVGKCKWCKGTGKR